MAQFTYTARNKEGENITDTIEASSRESVGQLLRSQGLLPTSITEKKQRRLRSWKFLLSQTFSRVSLLEKLTFINNLAVTMKAGLPVSRALKVLTKQMPNAYFRSVVGNITRDVESGKSLADSMAQYPKVFMPIIINMVRVGEESGELDKTLTYLGTQVARDYNLIRRTRGAMIYPSVVLGALVIMGYLMFTFVLPRLTATFKEFEAKLPFLTLLIIRIVDIFSRYAFVILAAVAVLITALLLWRRTASGQAILHRLSLSLPVVGAVLKKLNLARFSIIFSGLLRSGMQIVEALKATSSTMTNECYRDALADAAEKVKIGVDLVVALEKYPKLFTPMVTQMIQVGEESGTMEKVLAEVSNFYEAEVDDMVKNLSSIIEPVLVIVIGAFVGVLAVGLIMPIYNIAQNI